MPEICPEAASEPRIARSHRRARAPRTGKRKAIRWPEGQLLDFLLERELGLEAAPPETDEVVDPWF